MKKLDRKKFLAIISLIIVGTMFLSSIAQVFLYI